MKILICLDYSRAAKVILKEARPYFNAFPQAEIFVCNVIDMSLIAEGPEFAALEAEANEIKKLAAAAFDGRKINFNTEAGNPAQKIIEQVKYTGCDLLVLGTNGRTGMQHFMIGSVAERVIRNISCNTLIIPIKNKT